MNNFNQMNSNNNPQSPWAKPEAVVQSDSSAVTYLKQVYSLLAASLLVAVAAGWVGMRLPFAHEHPYILMFMFLGAVFLAFKVQNTATLFLATGISGLSLGPVIAVYVGAGMSNIVGQAVLLTGGIFIGLTFYAMTTKKDFSWMGGMLFAGVLVVVLGGLINIFVGSTALSFGLSAVGALVFSGLILWETQQLRNNPWAVPPTVAALSMYLNVINLFLSLLRILGIMGGDD
ncbi:MAG: Bax inhibitor-1/YccA family protein [Magnetococcales bacterium]|nr:Bax inhibitor-1/YccA family protein [Magnetococcales bacterium]